MDTEDILDFERDIRKVERAWRSENRQKISEFKREMGEEGREMRRRRVMSNLRYVKSDISDALSDYGAEVLGLNSLFAKHLIRHRLDALKKKSRKLEGELRYLNSTDTDGDMDFKIQRARERPLYDALDMRPGSRIPCPIHKGKDKNFVLKPSGFGDCFVCGWGGDSIKYMMEVEGMTFVQAVEALQ